jgi:hypothetical protein
MKILLLEYADGTRAWGPSAAVPDDFDTQAWADKRRASMRLLGIARVVEQFIEQENSNGQDNS